MTMNLRRIIWLLVVVGPLCCSGLIAWSTIMARFCEAKYAFKFRVVSRSKGSCMLESLPSTGTPRFAARTHQVSSTSGPSDAPSTEAPSVSPDLPTSTPLPDKVTTTQAVTTQTTERATTVIKSTDVLTDPTVQQSSTANQGTNPMTPVPGHVAKDTDAPAANHTKLRRKRCMNVYHHKIRIFEKNIFKGEDGLKLMKRVRHKIGKYVTKIRKDINYDLQLKNKNYLFLGTAIPGIEVKDHLFMANRGNVISWPEVKHLRKLMSTNNCQ